MTPTVLGIGGSLRPGSTTILALRAALAGAAAAGAQTDVFDLAEIRMPFFDGTYSLDGYSAAERDAIDRLFAAVDRADAVLLASPTYHNTLSGALKNALDFLEVRGEGAPARLVWKVVGLIAVQGGTSGTGVNTLTSMLLATRAMGAWVAPTMVSIPGSRSAFSADGVPEHPQIRQRLQLLGAEVARAGAQFAAGRTT